MHVKEKIELKNVRVHNLQSVDLSLNPNELIVFTGVSGSGKSSLAFDTIHVEGQRRYVESLSHYARRYMGDLPKPDVELVSGLSPTISIEQKTAGRNPRSTVGTLTGLYDYLRVLYARVAIPHCPISGEAVKPQSRERIIRTVQLLPEKSKIFVFSPYAKERKGEFKDDFQDLLRKGFTKVRIDGDLCDLEEEPKLDGSVDHTIDVVIDRIIVREDNHSRIAEAITQALDLGKGVCSVYDADTKKETLYSTHAYSAKSNQYYASLDPQDFSFNSPNGMCDQCNGLGYVQSFDLDLVIDSEKSISEDCCSIASSCSTVRYGNIYRNLAEIYGFSLETPWKKLSEKARKVFLHGTTKKWTLMNFIHPIKGSSWTDRVRWRGVLYEAMSRYAEATSDTYRRKAEKLMSEQLCPDCKGGRLKPYPAAALLGKKSISELTKMSIAEAAAFLQKLELKGNDALIADEVLKEIQERLRFLLNVGLHYLSLDRGAPTLSGGEAQRVRLASQIGCGLVGVTYILDEPSIGLHPRDNKKLIQTLLELRNMGNTVIVVEHDEETMLAADRVVDFGPGPGVNGGKVVANGTLKSLLRTKHSITGDYLSGKKQITIPKKRRKIGKELIKVKGAQHNNLKNIDVEIPCACFIGVTGVSGSGKSSLISDILYPALAEKLHQSEQKAGKHKSISGVKHIDKVIAIDQTPIGRNPRSNPGTYIKLFDEIRTLFSQLPESQARGYKVGRFSFNVKEGSCRNCDGMGMVRVDMDFMESAWIPCSVCKERRFDSETLSVLYKGKNIYDVLEMSVDRAYDFFQNIPKLAHKLHVLQRVGMGYIKIGQASTTLSGGEAQRIKLAKELVRPASGKTLYILDEPTTGLHFHDIQFLLSVLQELVDRGNTVLVIEHNMDVIKVADHLIDLGPEGGDEGGTLVATGSPDKLAKMNTPTGEALREVLYPDYETRIAEIQSRSTKTVKTKGLQSISISGAEQNNLKRINVEIPHKKLTVCTGPSGSGKSSFAFDTVYAEGQRRYIESLSPYARQFVKQMPKPKCEHVEGLFPAIAIEQKIHAGNPRSTVGTMTEIYDYLRILWARLGIAYCPDTGEVIQAISKDHVVDRIMSLDDGERLHILAPISLRKQDSFQEIITRFQRQGFLRIRLNGEIKELDQEIAFDRRRKNELCLVVDRLKLNSSMKMRVAEAVETASEMGKNQLIVMRDKGDLSFNLAFSVESTGKSYPEIVPRSFAFNVAEGMCMDCQGLGYQYGADITKNSDLMHYNVIGLLHILMNISNENTIELLEFVLDQHEISLFDSLRSLNEKQMRYLMHGAKDGEILELDNGLKFHWQGINATLAKLGKVSHSELKQRIIPLLDEIECFSCKGSRLNKLASSVQLKNCTIGDFCTWPISKCLQFIEKLTLPKEEKKLLEEVQRQCVQRLTFLNEVGLDYMSLNRSAPTLSGGETQRIRLARQLGTHLTGVLYVLDEPTIGLHPRDNDRLNKALNKLKELGNTLLMVEHDPMSVLCADYLVDFGPEAGKNGGHVSASGTIKQILKNKNSLSGQYLSGKKQIPIPKKRRSSDGPCLTINKAKIHNLKYLSAKIPLSSFVCISGVSGSGKSTLLHQVIRPAVERGIHYADSIDLGYAKVEGIEQIEQLISIDQNPIGTTKRSNVGTYSDILPLIREFYASLPEARKLGLEPKHFSYNHRRGMCTNCYGLGYKQVEMHFLPPVKVTCDQCHGMRLNTLSLTVLYAGKSFGEILQLTVKEARKLFENHSRICKRLDVLLSVGLDYLQLGQGMATLSGGEAQRIKLSRELSKRSQGKTLYLLDEPSTGLHSEDIVKLLDVLHKLVKKGNTVVVIEHNMDVIKNADFVLDLGPDAGEKGGELIAQGTPEKIQSSKNSWTGYYLNF
ncbi:MAG: excinuclease ABC subunit A [Waddliaceae bacterium]|nr:excinuclease ABC subunit A [Waddliaceae bacterium]